jgi:hypothetical protein
MGTLAWFPWGLSEGFVLCDFTQTKMKGLYIYIYNNWNKVVIEKEEPIKPSEIQPDIV